MPRPHTPHNARPCSSAGPSRGGQRVLAQTPLIGLEAIPCDVAGVRVAQQDRPFPDRHAPPLDDAARPAPLPAAPERIGPRIPRIVQHPQDQRVLQRLPVQFALARPAAEAAGKVQPLAAEVPHRGGGGAGACEGIEQHPQGLSHLGIRVERDPVQRIVDQSHRQRQLQGSAPRPVRQAAAQPGVQHVQFGLAHGALEAEQQPVVEVAGIVDAVLVEDQRVAQRADLQQAVPVGRVARQPRHLKPKHDPGAARADLRDQTLEPVAVPVCARLAEIGVDHHHAPVRPAERHRPFAQGVLAARALCVLVDLAHRGLAHVEIRVAAQMAGGHLAIDFAHAVLPAMCGRTIVIRMSTARASTSVDGGPARVTVTV